MKMIKNQSFQDQPTLQVNKNLTFIFNVTDMYVPETNMPIQCNTYDIISYADLRQVHQYICLI